MFRIMKKSRVPPKNYKNLMPYRQVAVLRRLPEDWESKIPNKFGSGDYSINEYGRGVKLRNVFTGYLEEGLVL